LNIDLLSVPARLIGQAGNLESLKTAGMNKYLSFLFVMVIACKSSSKKEQVDFNVPARLAIGCIDSAYSYDHKPDTSFQKIIAKDSVEFSTESVENCCDWYKGLKVGKRNDTIQMIDTRAGGKHFECDCDCLFRISIKFEKHFFDTTNSPILFWKDKKLK
jgi:hypothetical protein